MANYTITTDFSVKDNLTSGDAEKAILGADFDTEFDAISTAIATKVDTAGSGLSKSGASLAVATNGLSEVTIADGDEILIGDASDSFGPKKINADDLAAYISGEIFSQDVDITSTDAGATIGPTLTLHRNSASPADADVIGAVDFDGEDDGGNQTTYGRINAVIGDVTGGTEDGLLVLSTMRAGTLTEVARANSNGTVAIGNTSDDHTGSTYDNLILGTGSGDAGLTIYGGSAGKSGITFDNELTGVPNAEILCNHADPDIRFETVGIERFRVNDVGNVLFFKTAYDFTTTGVIFSSSGQQIFTGPATTPLVVNRQSNDGNIIALQQADSTEGSISVSGTTVSYNGAHLSRWSQWEGESFGASPSMPDIPRGTVLSNRDEMCEWKQLKYTWTKAEPTEEDPSAVQQVNAAVQYGGAEGAGETVSYVHDEGGPDEQTVTATVHVEDNEQLNRMVVSDVAGDKSVAGVFQGYDEDDETAPRDFYCAQTGDFVIRIASGVTVARGDLLESAGDGTARPQSDDVVRSSTVAKVTSTNVSTTHGDGSYCVPCVIMVC